MDRVYPDAMRFGQSSFSSIYPEGMFSAVGHINNHKVIGWRPDCQGLSFNNPGLQIGYLFVYIFQAGC
jgi:hypothetical protein